MGFVSHQIMAFVSILAGRGISALLAINFRLEMRSDSFRGLKTTHGGLMVNGLV